jgi:hypothetical protein
MSKVRVFAAAVLISIPLLSLDAAQIPLREDAVQVQLPQDAVQVQTPQDAARRLSDGKPTTADTCDWIYWFGVWLWFC